MTSAANGTDSLTWVFDLAGELTSEASTFNSSTVSYTYDNDGNRATLSLNGTQFTSYGYDDASRLTSMTQGTNVFGFGYDNANRRTSLTYPNGVSTAYTYDTLSRLTNLAATLSGTTITQWGYTYDNAGNRLTKTSPDYSETYTYDPLYRLTQAVRNTTGGGTNHWVWTYDAVGNRLANQLDDSVTSSTYNNLNEIQTGAGGGPLLVRGHLNKPGTATVNGIQAQVTAGNTFQATIQTTPGVNTFRVIATDVSGNVTNQNYQVTLSGSSQTYNQDLDGNLTQNAAGSTTDVYAWDAENQLKSITQNGTTIATFSYDPIGRRLQKVASGTTTNYLYATEDILREARSLGPTTTYVQGPDFDEPLSGNDGTVSTYNHADGLGSIIKVTNASGGISLSRQYDPFGNMQVGASTGDYSFTGREWDPETGLYYYRARYYDPASGRFLSQDPLGFAAGVNQYDYVDNDPVGFRDPTGLLPAGSDPDWQCLVCAVYAEAGTTPAPCQWAVASVILRRLGVKRNFAGNTPSTVCSVVAKGGGKQFNGYNSNDYRSCVHCQNPNSTIQHVMQNLENFPVVAPPATFHANNTAGMKAKRDREGYVQVPYPQCPTFIFHRPDPFSRPNPSSY
jgi:RHS repeat-associated protein